MKQFDIFTSGTKYENVKRVKEFKILKGNRNKTLPNIQEKEQILLKDGIFINDVIVNAETLNILDGQHRVQAYLNLINKGRIPNNSLLKVNYVTLKGITEMEYCRKLNTASHNWGLVDYWNSFIELGYYKDIYPQLQNLINNAPKLEINKKKTLIQGATERTLAVRRLLILLKIREDITISNKNLEEVFKNGQLIITNNDIQFAEIIINELTTILNICGFDNPSGLEDIIKLWVNKYRKFYDFNIWKIGFETYKKDLKTLKKSTQSDWKNIFSRINTELTDLGYQSKIKERK